MLIALISLVDLLSCGQSQASPSPQQTLQIGNVIVPEAFSKALQDGMSIPLYVHLSSANGTVDDQRLGNATIWLNDNKLFIRHIQVEHTDGNAIVNDTTQKQLTDLSDTAFNERFIIQLNPDAWLQFNFRQLSLQLVVHSQALGTLLRPRNEDIGASSAENLTSTLNYNLGIYNNQMREGGTNTSSYLALTSVSALREHHIIVNGSLYGLGSSGQQNKIYKAMYERDFAGYRIAAGMLDAWNLQSLGPITAISSGQIYGISWGNQANSIRFDNTHSLTPLIAFLPSAGEVHITRDGKLLSVQNFSMGSHEIDSSGLPYGIYDVKVDVIVNGRVVTSNVQRVNKLFSRNKSTGIPLSWQFWGGTLHMDNWYADDGEKLPAKETALLGVSASGSLRDVNWAASGYHYNALTVAETQFSLPLADQLTLSIQNMAASDRSWSAISSLSASLPGGFSSVWVSQEKTLAGNDLRRSNADNIALGTSVNLHALWEPLGTLTLSHNEDRFRDTRYYTADYAQSLYSNRHVSVGVRTGLQRYQQNSSSRDKYIAFDFTLPLGKQVRAGFTHQNGYTMANVSAQKQLTDSVFRTVGANLARAVSGNTGDDKTLSGGVWTRYETRYASGTLNVNSGADGYLNTNLTASGSLGWQGKNIAASGSSDGNAGIIFRTGVEDDGKLTARVNGRPFTLTGDRTYLPLEPYNRYDVEIQNSKDTQDTYDVTANRRSQFTLYPGNVVLLKPEIKQRVTVFGRIRAEDGSALTNVLLTNHIGRAHTDEHGEFVMDIDKAFPTIDFSNANNGTCEVALDLNEARGAVWVGDVICRGLRTFASNTSTGAGNES